MKMDPIPSNFRPIVRLLTKNLRKLVLILMRFRFDPLIFKQALRLFDQIVHPGNPVPSQAILGDHGPDNMKVAFQA